MANNNKNVETKVEETKKKDIKPLKIISGLIVL